MILNAIYDATVLGAWPGVLEDGNETNSLNGTTLDGAAHTELLDSTAGEEALALDTALDTGYLSMTAEEEQ